MREGLKKNQARILFALPEETSESEAKILAEQLLTEEEKARHFSDASQRHDYIVARSVLRLGLSSCCSVEPMEWHFTRSQRGKPFIVSPTDLSPFQFSLSHTRGLVALLVAFAAQTGVDVEHMERTNDLQLVARRICSPSELDSLSALADEEWKIRFFELWTLKEAYAKARGLGLALPLQKISFEIDSKKNIRTEGAPAWQFYLQEITENHMLAAALQLASSAHRYEIDVRKIPLITTRAD